MNIPLKLLFLNPVTIPDYDRPIAELVAGVKLPNTEVHVASLDLGPDVRIPHIEFRGYEAMVWGAIAEVAHYAGLNGYDGMAIGCFYDTALEEAREVSGRAVVCAPCQSALHIVSSLCNRFSVVITVEKCRVQMEDRIRHYGYADKLASFRPLGLHVDQLQRDTAATEEAMRRAVRAAVEEDRAEAVVLGCTVEFGFYQELQKEFGVPVVDAVYACFKGTEYAALNAARFGWVPSRRYSMEAPDPESDLGLGLATARPPLGPLIVV